MPKVTIETVVYAIVILLCVLAISIVALSSFHFTGTKAIYQGF